VKGWQIVSGGVIGDADAALGAPVLQVVDPALMREGNSGGDDRIVPGVMEVETVR